MEHVIRPRPADLARFLWVHESLHDVGQDRVWLSVGKASASNLYDLTTRTWDADPGATHPLQDELSRYLSELLFPTPDGSPVGIAAWDTKAARAALSRLCGPFLWVNVGDSDLDVKSLYAVVGRTTDAEIAASHSEAALQAVYQRCCDAVVVVQ